MATTPSLPAKQTVESLQRQIDAIEWYHEFDFGNGLRASTSMPAAAARREIWRFIESHLEHVEFKGKSVLDIGCWDGYWSFYAERRGARSVLASDDCTQNWATGRALLLAKELLNSAVEVDQELSVYELSRLGRTFDVILCMGVYYHLIDPFAAFSQVRHCCHPDSVVIFEGDATLALRPDTYFFDPRDHSRSIFIPTPHGLRQMLQAAYFAVDKQVWNRPPRRPSLRRRFEIFSTVLGAKDPAGLTPPAKTNRMITLCTPFSGANPLHHYKPPFGLHRYDSRFR